VSCSPARVGQLPFSSERQERPRSACCSRPSRRPRSPPGMPDEHGRTIRIGGRARTKPDNAGRAGWKIARGIDQFMAKAAAASPRPMPEARSTVCVAVAASGRRLRHRASARATQYGIATAIPQGGTREASSRVHKLANKPIAYRRQEQLLRPAQSRGDAVRRIVVASDGRDREAAGESTRRA